VNLTKLLEGLTKLLEGLTKQLEDLTKLLVNLTKLLVNLTINKCIFTILYKNRNQIYQIGSICAALNAMNILTDDTDNTVFFVHGRSFLTDNTDNFLLSVLSVLSLSKIKKMFLIHPSSWRFLTTF
jgi:hypothetical protein